MKISILRVIGLSLVGFVILLSSYTQTAQALDFGPQWYVSGSNLYYNGGNVGIGTASPDAKAKLHVVGGYFYLDRGDTASSVIGANGNLVLEMDRDNGTVNGNYIAFAHANGAWLMTITAVGNIGIGTNNPTQKLSVNGTVLAKQVIVSTASSNWPDYVFDSNYSPMSISDLAKYVQQNKHLPDVPDANTISQQGLSLGEMQKQQMKQIEDLTLYIIDLQKQITDLKATK